MIKGMRITELEQLIRAYITINLGANPRRGGSPPRERMRIEMEVVVFGWSGLGDGSCLMEYVFRRCSKNIRDPDVMQ